jgi:ABC-type antimicrobial peptide transport system permease subunit
LIGLFGVLAVVLAAVGVYGVIAYSVTLRTREVGIRMALGAARIDVLAMVLRSGAILTGAGLACGFLASLALTRLLATLLFEVKPIDLMTSFEVALVLAAIALIACYLPARRAANADPIAALRFE